MAIEARRTAKEARDALAKRRADADARAKAAINALRSSADLRQTQMATDALEALLMRGTGLRFATLSDLLAPQPWALDGSGAVQGHLLTVDDAIYLTAIEDLQVDGLTFAEVFNLGWVDLDERAVWTREYTNVLGSLAYQAEQQMEAERRREALRDIMRLNKGKT